MTKTKGRIDREGSVSFGDASLSGATVESAFRPPTAHEGALYLRSLRRTIRDNPGIFGTLVFPAALEAQAQSELGFSGSAFSHKTASACMNPPPKVCIACTMAQSSWMWPPVHCGLGPPA